MLARIVPRVKAVTGVDDVLVAIPTATADDAIASLCVERGWSCFRGSPDDVLDRYYQAAREVGADQILRVTADNPLTCSEQAARLIQRHLETRADCTHNITSLGSGMPLGTASELFAFSALEVSWKEGRQPHHREHVDEYVYEHPERFRSEMIPAPPEIRRPEYRLTVDTKEDLELMRKIFGALSRPGRLISVMEVVPFLDRHADLLRINRHVQQKRI
jgi:spore coat polysaccharide biosynthesis protein SpsF